MMAEDPKSSTRKSTKATPPSDKVEDAEVIEEKTAAAGAEETTGSEAAAASDPASETADGEGADREEPQDIDAKPEPADEAAEKPTPAPRRRGVGVFLALLLGGAAAAVIGFAAARYVVPEGWPFPGVAPEEDPLVAMVESQNDRLGSLADRVAGLEADTSLAQAVEATQTEVSRLDAAVTERLDALSARLDGIVDRLDAVERLAPEGSEAAQAAAAAYERELAALREMFEAELAALEAQQADVGQLEEAAAEAARAAKARAALARVVTALDTGQPFSDALADLRETMDIAAPAALAEVAETGLPTLAAVQEAFPPAAREALDAAIQAAVDDGSMSRMSAFLRSQLGTRSLEPREGDDPDAVLSRAEAALKRGDIAGALVELEAMPEASAPALAAWKEMAAARQAALDAGSALARELNAK